MLFRSCRILAKTADELKHTDIAQHALDALAESRVRDMCGIPLWISPKVCAPTMNSRRTSGVQRSARISVPVATGQY